MNIICSFCGKDAGEVDKIIAGPGVFICNECGDIVAEIFSSTSSKSAIINVSWPEFEGKTISQMLGEMESDGNLTVSRFLKNCRELQKVEIDTRLRRLKETKEELKKLQDRKKVLEDEIATTEKMEERLLKEIKP